MNVLSLFDGMSCGQIALERAGIKVDKYYASEIDKHAIKVTMANYPNTIQLGSITEWKNWNIEKPDMIIGGSPCQGFSFAGKQLNFNDERSKLFFVFVDILKHYKPKYFLLENVVMKQEYQDVISEHLKVKPIMINSSLVSAQNRKRLYWTNIKIASLPADKGYVVSDISENIVSDKYNLSSLAQAKIEKYSKGYKLTGKAPTLTTELAHSTGSNITPKLIKEIGKNRRATPVECERLQTVPDNYTSMVSDTQRYRMLGNGWTVDVIAHIFKGLLNENL